MFPLLVCWYHNSNVNIGSWSFVRVSAWQNLRICRFGAWQRNSTLRLLHANIQSANIQSPDVNSLKFSGHQHEIQGKRDTRRSEHNFSNQFRIHKNYSLETWSSLFPFIGYTLLSHKLWTKRSEVNLLLSVVFVSLERVKKDPWSLLRSSVMPVSADLFFWN